MAAARSVADRPMVPAEGTAVAFLRVAGRLHARVEEVLAPLGITYRQYRLLASLVTDTGGDGPHWGWWAPPAGADDPSVELVERGMVRRVQLGVGSTGLDLTPSGAASVGAASERLRDLVAGFGAPLGLPEVADLDRLLGKARAGTRWSTASRA